MSRVGRVSFILLFPVIFYFLGSCKNILPGDKVRLKCRYMAYACGECEPQYRIEEISKVYKGKVNRAAILGKDVKVVFKSHIFEKKLDSMVAPCAICYDFYIDGDLAYLSTKGYYRLIADTCVAKLRSNDCCK
jgi:hypothetical protein